MRYIDLALCPEFQAQGEISRRPTWWSCLPKQGGACFNPLPLPKQGEMYAVTLQPQADIETCSFNPLPLPKQGEIPPSPAARPTSL